MPQTIDNMSVTWTNSLTTYTGIKLNAAGSSDANSAAGSLLLDLQVGGNSFFRVGKNGTLTAGRYATAGFFGARFDASSGVFSLTRSSDGAVLVTLDGSGNNISAGSVFATNGNITLAGDTILTRRAAANLRLGAADVTGDNAAASLKAQTLSVQSVASGGTLQNVAGANLTITGSQGTGTGAGGSIIFQVAPAGSSGTAQNALVDAFRIIPGTAGDRFVVAAGTSTAFTNFQGFTTPSMIVGTFSGALNAANYAGNQIKLYNASISKHELTSAAYGLGSDVTISWSSTTSSSDAKDVILARDAPGNILALRNGGTSGTPVPQTFRVYNWTDGTNGEWAAIRWSSNAFNIFTEAAGSGSNSRRFEMRAGDFVFGTHNQSGGGWSISTAGHFLATIDNLYDIGGSTGNRPRDIYAATAVRAPIWVFTSPTGAQGTFRSEADGVLRLTNSGINDFGRLQFGGTNSSFPALKRVSANLQVIAADNSGSAGLIVGNQALATNATDGFLYVPTCAGTPTGTPTAQTGTVPIVVDTTNNKLYFYSGAAWRDAGP